MLALRYYGQRDIRLEEVNLPPLKENEVLIKVTDAGISQTQINEFMEGPFIINKTPLIPSQEFGGIVKKVANKNDEYLLNKMVAVLPLVSCKKCIYCKEKREELCNNFLYHGLLGLDGGFAQYCIARKENIFLIDKKELLTFVEPILVGIHSANIYSKFYNLKKKKVLILGAGAIGISVATIWRDYFKADITLNDIIPQRENIAKECGFEVLKKDRLKKEYDVVIDAAGTDPLSSKPAFIEGFEYLKKGGTLLNIGTYFHPLELIPSNILLQQQQILTSIAYNSADVQILQEVIDSIKIDFSKLIQKIKLENIIEDGYFALEVNKEDFIRIVVEP